MKISDIDIPEALIDAQRKGTLVVFAGAGVSKYPPSSLPDFQTLADQVSGETLKRSKDEPIDQFLGQLETLKVNVHARTQGIIANPDSKPNALHRALLSLFPSANNVRLVTTNFDRHFTLVAKELFLDKVDLFFAPALPLGHEFNGIVYLHGCIDRHSKDMVLTDRDFGLAYITDGWARRFLQAMFASFTVLFVGYSHNDTVMNYLSRALPADSGQRYALTASGKDERWSFLGVTPISYTSVRGPYSHAPLRRSIERWSDLAKMGALDHERKIRDLVELPPPIDPEKQDYLMNALRDLENLRFYLRYAKSLDWLHWAEDNLPVFRHLFQPAHETSGASQELATWFAQNFVCEHSEEALDIIRRHGQVIAPVLWHEIVMRLSSANHPDPVTFAKWTSILLGTTCYKDQSDYLGYLLNSCLYPDDNLTAISLFKHMTNPQLHLEPHFKFSNQDQILVDAEVSLQTERYWLNDSWNNYFKPNIADFAESLLPIVEAHLRQAHNLLRSLGMANDNVDQISRLRSAIEPHEQNRDYTEGVILTDTARDILAFMINQQPSKANYLIESWGDSSVPILRRLAVHGVSESPAYSPDNKIAWLLQKGWLYRYGLKHEVFRLLELAYPEASRNTRTQLLEQACLGPQGQDADGHDENTSNYAIYNLLVWLNQADPGCTLVSDHLKAIQRSYPKFRPREYPDLDSYFVAGHGSMASLLTVDELLGNEPDDAMDFLLCYKEDNLDEPTREELLSTLAQAVSHSFSWSWKLVIALQEKNEPDIDLDLWESLLHGWKLASLTEEEWTSVLNFLEHYPLLKQIASAVVELLERGVTEQQTKLPLSCFPLIETIADRLWEECMDDYEDEVELEGDNWLYMAINHVSGKIVLVWLHVLSRRRAQAKEAWDDIPTEYKNRFNKILSGEAEDAQLGRVILASQIQYLFALDANWTEDNVFPLLDWTVDKNRAEQSWHGYLAQGRWNHTMLPKLLPLYKNTFKEFKNRLSVGLRERFCRHLAGIAIFSTIDPLKDGWLRDFLKVVDTDGHKALASAIKLELYSIKEDEAKDLWDRWMDRYWSDRITNVPVPMTPNELEEMIYWIIELGPVFPQAVDRVCAHPAPRLENTHLYRLLDERSFAMKHPDALVKLLLHLLPNAAQPFWQCKYVENLIRSLLKTSTPHSEVLKVCNQLAQFDCPNASELGNLCSET